VRRFLGASISQFGLKIIATICMLCYIVSKTIIQRGIMDISQYDEATLLQAMANGSTVMGIATVAIILQLLAGAALSIYSFLLVEGFIYTKKLQIYILNILVFSMLSEFTYDYAFYSSNFYLDSQNPMIAMLIGLIMLCALRFVRKDGKKHGVLCLLIIIAAMTWCYLLKVEFGIVAVILIAIYYFFHENRGMGLFLGFIAGISYITGIFAIYPLFIYSGKRGSCYNKYIFYAIYPISLLICSLITMLI